MVQNFKGEQGGIQLKFKLKLKLKLQGQSIGFFRKIRVRKKSLSARPGHIVRRISIHE
jgi:hypothetical protein